MAVNPITTMISYSWDDTDAAELLHVELALRGLTVFHDRCTFPVGQRIASSMADAVETCDSFVAYLTESSLYIGKPAGSPRPALDNEFIPLMARWRRSQTAPTGDHQVLPPVVLPLTHGLGDPRTEAPERVRRESGEDISSLWTPVVLDQSTSTITKLEAAQVARSVIGAVLKSGRRPGLSGPLELALTTRGEGQPPALLTVDATPIVGGALSIPGAPEDWDRFFVAIRDLATSMAQWSHERRLDVSARAHLTACIAFGRVFNQAAGWQPVVRGRFGPTAIPPGHPGHPDLHVLMDRTGGSDDLTIEIDLLGGNVRDLANHVIRDLDKPSCGRLQVTRTGQGELSAEDVGAMAGAASDAVRTHVAELRPTRIHILCAAPAEFALLLGHRLTSLHADLWLYERHEERYTRSLIIPRHTP